jgi:hypothetical protein
MTLTEAQIDRYSRQIIVPHIGGRGQERLLAAHILLSGDACDIEAPLAYLVGAGVGTIALRVSDEHSGMAEKIAAMPELNADVSVALTNQIQSQLDLALLIIGSEASRKVADEIANRRDLRALVIARLDVPGKIAVIPDTQGARVLDASKFGAVAERSDAADFIAMLATAEAFKLIAGFAENPAPAIIKFDGYETSVRAHP